MSWRNSRLWDWVRLEINSGLWKFGRSRMSSWKGREIFQPQASGKEGILRGSGIRGWETTRLMKQKINGWIFTWRKTGLRSKFTCLWNKRYNNDNFNPYIYLVLKKIFFVSDPSLVREESYTLLAGSNLTLPCLEAQEVEGRGIHTLSWYCRYRPCTNCPRNCFRRCTWKNSFTLGHDLVFFKIPFS